MKLMSLITCGLIHVELHPIKECMWGRLPRVTSLFLKKCSTGPNSRDGTLLGKALGGTWRT
jgi:hypothetical protein